MAHKRRDKHLKRKIVLYMVGVIVCSIILLTAGFYLYVMRDIPSVKVLKRLENKPVSSLWCEWRINLPDCTGQQDFCHL